MAISARGLPHDRVLVCDGAMGTMIHSMGVTLGRSFDEVNLSQPEIVEDIHRRYLESGAQILETNTFGANRAKLETYGLAQKVRDINVTGARLAESAAGERALVAGAVGPTGRLLQPFGPLRFDETFDLYREQISALCEGGVDLIIVETIQDMREAKAALLAAKTITEIPLICQMSFGQEGRTMMGTSPEAAAVVLSSFGAQFVGANCGTGPQDMLDVIEAMAGSTAAGLSAQPNAGLPQVFEGRLMYLSTPEYMAQCAVDFVKAGAVVVGGCCGTTPDHIKAIASAVSGLEVCSRRPILRMTLASRTSVFEVGGERVTLIGDRIGQGINPEMADDIRAGHFQAVQDEAEAQFGSGAKVLEVDCDLVSGERTERLIELVQTAAPAALYLKANDVAPLERALRSVEGRAIVSLNGTPDRIIESLLPLAHRYGSAVFVAADSLNSDTSPEARLRAAGRIVRAAEESGLSKTDLLINPGKLIGNGALLEDTLRALKLIKCDLKVGTAVEIPSKTPADLIRMTVEAGADALICDPARLNLKT